MRLVGLILLALGLGALVADLASLGRLAALGEWWAWADRDSLLLLQPAVERHITPAIWDPGIQTLLEWPLAVELLVLGGAVFGIGLLLRRRAQSVRSAGRRA